MDWARADIDLRLNMNTNSDSECEYLREYTNIEQDSHGYDADC